MVRQLRWMMAGAIAVALVESCGGKVDDRNTAETSPSNSAGGRVGSSVSLAGADMGSPGGSGDSHPAAGGSVEWTQDPPPLLKCGNGILDPPERCDDADNTSDDGCSRECLVEYGWECPRAGVSCSLVSTCGNGVIEGAEICDDGNREDSDGCSANCMEIALGWRCSPVAYGGCQPICGDGQIVGDEASDCRLVPRCGDGVIQPAEDCDPGLSEPIPYGKGGCTGACRTAPYCGDGNLDAHYDEECDPPQMRFGAFICDEDCALIWTP